MKNTLGPWVARQNQWSRWEILGGGGVLANIATPEDPVSSPKDWRECAANARLVAAAPAMLDALRKVYDGLMSDPPPGHVQKHVGPDDVIYQLDGQLMYQAINAARDAIALASSEDKRD